MKNQPTLHLADVLRRRRTTLKSLIAELGITTHGGLEAWCVRMGLVGPTLKEFEEIVPPTFKVNSLQEGVVVLEAPIVVAESDGRVLDVDPSFGSFEFPEEALEGTQKKRKQKKDVPTIEG